jgi:hypothetical protein
MLFRLDPPEIEPDLVDDLIDFAQSLLRDDEAVAILHRAEGGIGKTADDPADTGEDGLGHGSGFLLRNGDGHAHLNGEHVARDGEAGGGGVAPWAVVTRDAVGHGAAAIERRQGDLGRALHAEQLVVERHRRDGFGVEIVRHLRKIADAERHQSGRQPGLVAHALVAMLDQGDDVRPQAVASSDLCEHRQHAPVGGEQRTNRFEIRRFGQETIDQSGRE